MKRNRDKIAGLIILVILFLLKFLKVKERTTLTEVNLNQSKPVKNVVSKPLTVIPVKPYIKPFKPIVKPSKTPIKPIVKPYLGLEWNERFCEKRNCFV